MSKREFPPLLLKELESWILGIAPYGADKNKIREYALRVLVALDDLGFLKVEGGADE